MDFNEMSLKYEYSVVTFEYLFTRAVRIIKGTFRNNQKYSKNANLLHQMYTQIQI